MGRAFLLPLFGLRSVWFTEPREETGRALVLNRMQVCAVRSPKPLPTEVKNEGVRSVVGSERPFREGGWLCPFGPDYDAVWPCTRLRELTFPCEPREKWLQPSSRPEETVSERRSPARHWGRSDPGFSARGGWSAAPFGSPAF